MQSGHRTGEKGNSCQQLSPPEASTWRDVLAGLRADEDGSLAGSTGGLQKSGAGSSKSSAGSSEKRARDAVVSEVANALHFGHVEEEDIEKMSPALRSEVWPSRVQKNCSQNDCIALRYSTLGSVAVMSQLIEAC